MAEYIHGGDQDKKPLFNAW